MVNLNETLVMPVATFPNWHLKPDAYEADVAGSYFTAGTSTHTPQHHVLLVLILSGFRRGRRNGMQVRSRGALPTSRRIQPLTLTESFPKLGVPFWGSP